MYATFLTLILAQPPVLDDDLSRFPTAGVAEQQLQRCRDHTARLRWLRSVRGWSGGAYDVWIAETEFRAAYWRRLGYAHLDSNLLDLGDGWRRRQLGILREMIGATDYYGGWFPELLPPEPTPARMPRASEGNNAR